jgi:hypothetical protein
MDRLDNQLHPMNQTFPNNDEVCRDDNAPFTKLELFSHAFKSIKVNFNIFPGQHITEPVLETTVSNRFPPPTSLKQLEDVPSSRMVYNSARDCSKLVQVHSKDYS